ncbi:MAG: alpha/beta hydrolase [Actinomycetes bacterium]
MNSSRFVAATSVAMFCAASLLAGGPASGAPPTTALSSGPADSAGSSEPAARVATGPSVLSAPVQYASINGARIGYRKAGKGRPLVLIPGSGNTMAEWDPALLDRLARDRKVIVFDLRGAGTSTGSVTGMTIKTMADDVARLIKRITKGQADVLGWSMGGYVAQDLTIRYPKRVHRLILVSTNPGGPTTIPPRPWALKIITNPYATFQQRMSVLFPPDQLGTAGAWLSRVGAAYAADHYQPSNAFEVSPATQAAQVNAAGPQWLRRGKGTATRLGCIRQRVLIGAGRNDVIVPIRNVALLRKGIRQAQTVIYSDAGHAFLFQPQLGFARAVDRFLSKR